MSCYIHAAYYFEELEDKPSNVNLLLLQMGDSEMTGSSSDGSGSESLSWMADHMDWDFESDETDPAIIFNGPPDSKDTEVRMGHDDKDEISEAESVIGNIPTTVDLGVLPNDEMNPEGRIFFWRYLVGLQLGRRYGSLR